MGNFFLAHRYYYILVFLQIVLIIGLIVFLVTKDVTPRTSFAVSLLNKDSIQLTPSNLLKHFYEPKPGIAPQEKPDWLGNYDLVNTINKDSLNERFDYATQTPPHTYRIVVLGDSWTYGLNVSTKDNYSEQLEDMLNQSLVCPEADSFEVINLGVSNYDIAFSVERYKVRGQKYNPDLIIWFLHENDFNDTTEGFLEAQKIERDNLENSLLAGKKKEYGSFVGYKAMNAFNQNKVLNTEAAFLGHERMRKTYSKETILKYQSEFLMEYGREYSTPTILYAPVRVFDYSDAIWDVIDDFMDSDESVKLYKSPIVLKPFGENSTDTNPDFHPSPSGHKRIALDMLNYLLQTRMSECSLKKLPQ